MKKILLTLIYTLSLTVIFAQDNSNQVWRVWYMTAKDGKAKQLEKGLTDHIEKFHPAGGWPEYFFEVISGPNTGSLMGFSGPHSWKSFDERVRSQGDIDHFNKFIRWESFNIKSFVVRGFICNRSNFWKLGRENKPWFC